MIFGGVPIDKTGKDCEGDSPSSETCAPCNDCCGYGKWSPCPEDVCEGTSYKQRKVAFIGNKQACPDEERDAVGTGAPIYGEWSEWTPKEDTICEGVEYGQTRIRYDEYLLIPCEPQTEKRDAVGTLVCTFTESWCESTTGQKYVPCQGPVGKGSRVFTNPFPYDAVMVISGYVDDDVVIDGEIFEAGLYGFRPDCMHLNGAHSFYYSAVVDPNEETTVGYLDNHGSAWGICITVNYTVL